MPPHLLRRPGRPGGRFPEGAERLRRAGRGDRPALPEWLSATAPQPGRLAAGTLSGQRLLHAAAAAGRRRRRQSSEDQREVAAGTGIRADLASGCRPRQALPSRYEQRGQRRPGIPRYHRPVVQRRQRCSNPPGDRARHRRTARPQGDGDRADGVPHERGSLGLPGARADSSPHAGTRFEFRGGVRGGALRQRLYHAYLGGGGHRLVRLRSDVRVLRRVLPRDRHRVRTIDVTGALESPRSRRTILDGDSGVPHLQLP